MFVENTFAAMKKLILIIIAAVFVAGSVIFIQSYANKQSRKASVSTPTDTLQPSSTSKPEGKQYNAPPAMTIDASKTYVATMETSSGTIVLELFAGENPVTVNNFVFLAREGFYDGTRFHRILKDFMIQGGDPAGDGTGGPGYTFEDEPITRDYTSGIIAMANRGPNTNGSQFFIMHGGDTPLPKSYVIFGQVSTGLDVVDAIANTPVSAGPSGESSVPTEDVLVTRVTIEEK